MIRTIHSVLEHLLSTARLWVQSPAQQKVMTKRENILIHKFLKGGGKQLSENLGQFPTESQTLFPALDKLPSCLLSSLLVIFVHIS